MTELYFSTVKIIAQRSTRISAVATVLLITNTFTETERQRQRQVVDRPEQYVPIDHVFVELFDVTR